MAHYAAVKERLVAGVPRDGTAIVGVDDEWCSAIADRLASSGKRRCARLGAARIARRDLCRGTSKSCARHGGGTRDRRTVRHRLAARHAQRPERRVRGGSRARARPRPDGDPGRSALVPRPRPPHGAGRPPGKVLLVNDSKATNADSAAQALACFSDIFWIAGGKPKTGGIESLRNFFPRIRKAYLIGEAAKEFAATLGEVVPHEIDGTLDKALAAAMRDAATSAAPRAGRAAVAGLRVVRPVSQFRGPRRRLPRAGPGAAGHRSGKFLIHFKPSRWHL